MAEFEKWDSTLPPQFQVRPPCALCDTKMGTSRHVIRVCFWRYAALTDGVGEPVPMLCRRAATGTAARCRGLTSATCSDAVVQRRWGSTSAHGGTAAIERLPSSVPRRVFDTAAGSNHGSIVAESFGDERNEPIVFFHGGGQNRWTWERTAITMAEAGYFAVTVDMKGHGMFACAAVFPFGHAQHCICGLIVNDARLTTRMLFSVQATATGTLCLSTAQSSTGR